MSVSAIILAAGKSTRMKSTRPKVLHEVCGRPMLYYALQACYSAGCEKVIVVVGHGRDEVVGAFSRDKRIIWVEQGQQLGTGHAARVCEAELKKLHGDVFIVTGDSPLVRGQILKSLLQAHQDEHAAASMATAVLDDPYGYGRIVRDAEGQFVEIVEQIDCSPDQAEIKEVFPSYYCVKIDSLIWALQQLKDDNKKREYYLTDIFGHLRRDGKRITAVQAVAAEDILGVNTREQLSQIDAIMQDRIQREHREAGVSISSPINTYIESGVQLGPDTVIYPFSYVGRDSSIGARCTVGPFAFVARNAIVPEGSVIAGNVSAESVMGVHHSG